jgi:hypothetical protein
MRPHVAALAVALLLVTSGCLGVITGSEPLTGEADRAAVDGATVEESGYELAAEEEQLLEREFTVAGQTRRVEATNKLTRYERSFEVPGAGTVRAGVFAVVSTPAFSVAGQALNPVGRLSNRELVQRVGSNYEGLSVGAAVDNRSVATLGSTMEVTKYDGTATIAGAEVGVYVHVGAVRSGEDFVVVAAVYPQFVDDEETVLRFVRNLQH